MRLYNPPPERCGRPDSILCRARTLRLATPVRCSSRDHDRIDLIRPPLALAQFATTSGRVQDHMLRGSRGVGRERNTIKSEREHQASTFGRGARRRTTPTHFSELLYTCKIEELPISFRDS